MKLRGSLSFFPFLLAVAGSTGLMVSVAMTQGVPNSIGLLYFPEKNFKAGDWALYTIRASDIDGNEDMAYQHILIGEELEYRGESCFWLETGWGPARDSLGYTCVLVSGAIFEDEMPEVRHTIYMRKMHTGSDDQGNPLATDVNIANPGRKLRDLSYLRPTVVEIGTDTLEIAGRTFVCKVVEETSEVAKLQDLPDSTARFLTRTFRRRWVTPEVPITGLVKENERKEFYRHVWPLGELSSDFPNVMYKLYEIENELVDLGSGAEPKISDRIMYGANPSQ